MKRLIATLGLLSFLVSGITFASDRLDTNTKRPCKADAEKFCADVKSGKKNKIECLKEHADYLSQECKDKINAKHEDQAKRWESCKADKQKFCKSKKKGAAKIRKCLQDHKADLSQECQQALEKN